jgi:predicted nucleic acid-binding protein
MFLLDTNVLSVLMAAQPPPEVAAWVSAQPEDLLFTAAICQSEILSGLAVLPEGRRRSEWEAAARAMFLDDFEGRVLPFDTVAAEGYADMYARCRRAGRPVATADLMIAAIARVHGAGVVTRNVTDFDTCGVPIVNPWTAKV